MWPSLGPGDERETVGIIRFRESTTPRTRRWLIGLSVALAVLFGLDLLLQLRNQGSLITIVLAGMVLVLALMSAVWWWRRGDKAKPH
jgi:hypothetical protein